MESNRARRKKVDMTKCLEYWLNWLIGPNRNGFFLLQLWKLFYFVFSHPSSEVKISKKYFNLFLCQLPKGQKGFVRLKQKTVESQKRLRSSDGGHPPSRNGGEVDYGRSKNTFLRAVENATSVSHLQPNLTYKHEGRVGGKSLK